MRIIKTIIPLLGYKNLLVPEYIRATRLKTCVECPSKKYFKATGSCLLCGCFVREKTELKNQECPEGYWDKED